MKIMQTKIFDMPRRIRVVERANELNYTTYSEVFIVTKEWDEDTKLWYYVLYMREGKTATYNTKEWSIQKEKFVEFM